MLRINTAFKLLCFGIFSLGLTANAQEVPKLVLLEEFTNTYCPNCIFGHEDFHNEVLNPLEDQEVLHISYHVSFPIADDVFYQGNPLEINERTSFYSVEGTPSIVMLGNLNAPSTDILPFETLQPVLGQTSPLSMELTEEYEGSERLVKLKIQTVGEQPNDLYKIRVVAVEKTATYIPPFEGMEENLRNVFRKTVNGWVGSLFFAPPTGVSTTYTFDYSVDDAWDMDQIYTIAFIQSDATKEILNSASSWGNISEVEEEIIEVTGIQDLGSEKIDFKLFPTISSDNIYLVFDENECSAKCQIYSSNGLVSTIDNLEYSREGQIQIDISNLSKGMYWLNLVCNNKKGQSKFVVN